jgi:hypothetical protein
MSTTIAAMKTVIINKPGLTQQHITVRADSTVQVADDRERCYGPFDQPKMGLEVDGRFISLVMCKFLVGRPELSAAIEAVRAEVEVAIASLQPTGAQSDVEGSTRAQCICGQVYWRNRASGRCYDITDAEIFRCVGCDHDLTPHLGELSELGANPDEWELAFLDQAQTCPCLYFGDEALLCVQRGGCQGWAPYPAATGPALVVDPAHVRAAERLIKRWGCIPNPAAGLDIAEEAIGLMEEMLRGDKQ